MPCASRALRSRSRFARDAPFSSNLSFPKNFPCAPRGGRFLVWAEANRLSSSPGRMLFVEPASASGSFPKLHADLRKIQPPLSLASTPAFALRALQRCVSRAVYFHSSTHDRYWQLQLATATNAVRFGHCHFSPWHTAAHAGCNRVAVAATALSLPCCTAAQASNANSH